MPDYTLHLTQKQAEVVNAALDIYMCLHLGQMERGLDPIENTLLRDKPFSVTEQCREHLREVQRLITGTPNGGPGINNERVDDRARVAYDLHQVVRRALAVARESKPDLADWAYRQPHQTDGEPLATVERG